jgi:hypothetical protein
LHISHKFPFDPKTASRLEVQTGFTSSISEGLYATVICKPSAIEYDRSNPGLFGAGSNELSHFGRGFDAERAGAQRTLMGGSAGDRYSFHVIDDLGIDVTVAPKHG